MVLTRNASLSLQEKRLDKPEVDYTRGFGSFDFFPYHGHKASWESDLPRHWSTQWDHHQSLHFPQPLDKFPFKRLPAEIRVKLYQTLLASLYGSPKSTESSGNGICFLLTDADYHLGWEDFTGDDAMECHVTGDPDKRNLDLRPGAAAQAPLIDVLAVYQSIQADPDNLALQPSGWHASKALVTLVHSDGHDNGDAEMHNPFPEPAESEDEWDVAEPPPEIRLVSSKWAASSQELDNPMLPKYLCHRNYLLSICRMTQREEGCLAPHQDEEDVVWGINNPAARDEGFRNNATMDDCICDYRPISDYEDIRILGQVSGAFTEELGHCLWAGATVRMDDPELFFPFVRDRPAVVPFVKGLVLELQLWGDLYDPISTALDALCGFVADKMELNSFRVVVTTTFEQLLEPEVESEPAKIDVARQRVEEWALAFRKLKLNGNFMVDVVWNRHNPDLIFALANRPISAAKTAAVAKGLRNKWLPDYLRAKEETEQSLGKQQQQ